MMKRIVVVNFTRMGDILQSGPLLRSLKTAHPQSRISLLVFHNFRDVAERLPMVDEVIGFDVDDLVTALDAKRGDLARGMQTLKKLVLREELQHADLLVNLSHTPLSATLTTLLKPRQIWGMYRTANGNLTVNGDAFQYLYSIMEERRWNPFNLVEIYQSILTGSDRSPYLEFKLTAEDHLIAGELLEECGIGNQTAFCVIQAGASGAARRWPAASFAQLADRLQNKGYSSVLVGSKDERHLAEEIASLTHKGIGSLTGRTSVGVLGAILARAHRLVSNDTGTIHLAAAVGTRAVGLFLGPASAKDTAPYGSGHLILEPDLECAPCSYQKTCNDMRCHRVVSVDQVLALTLSEDNIEALAATMQGSRIYRTHVHPNGNFELQQMNGFHTGPDLKQLAALRAFWQALSDDGATAVAMNGIDKQALSELRAIWLTADRSMKTLLGLTRDAGGNAQTIARQLQKQLEWQKQLRDFVDHYPDLSPLPRFLLARLNRIHTQSLTAYLADLTGILQDFDKGLRLLAGASKSETEIRESHVATA
jgi:ADP-heptose:LPS heptosyltransferase